MRRPEGVVRQLLVFLSAALVGVLPVVALATDKTPPPIDLAGQAVQLAGYLLILVVLAALAVHLGRRFRPMLGGRGPIHIVDGHNLAPGVGVRLIRIGSQGWLIGVTKERVSLLAEISMENLAATELSVASEPTAMWPNQATTGRTGVVDHEPKL